MVEHQNRWSVTLALLDFFLRKKLVLVKLLILWASCHSQPNLILTNVGLGSARHILLGTVLSYFKLLTILRAR